MPVMSGLVALRAIREGRQKGLDRPVIIALTGYNSDPDRERLLNAGFDAVIGKPFRLDALDALVRGSSEGSPPISEPKTSIAFAQTPLDNLLERVGGDDELAGKMVATFLRDTPRRMAGIEKALRQQRGEDLASLAHALKGSVGIFGAEDAREYAEELQSLGRASDFPQVAVIYKRLKEEIAKLEANLRGYAGQKRSPTRGAGSKIKRRRSHPKRE
jgi:CheY-like chemotaxis protein